MDCPAETWDAHHSPRAARDVQGGRSRAGQEPSPSEIQRIDGCVARREASHARCRVASGGRCPAIRGVPSPGRRTAALKPGEAPPRPAFSEASLTPAFATAYAAPSLASVGGGRGRDLFFALHLSPSPEPRASRGGGDP